MFEESADLIFHLMVLLEDSKLTLYDVEKTLKKNEMIDIINYDKNNIFAKILEGQIPSKI